MDDCFHFNTSIPRQVFSILVFLQKMPDRIGIHLTHINFRTTYCLEVLRSHKTNFDCSLHIVTEWTMSVTDVADDRSDQKENMQHTHWWHRSTPHAVAKDALRIWYSLGATYSLNFVSPTQLVFYYGECSGLQSEYYFFPVRHVRSRVSKV